MSWIKKVKIWWSGDPDQCNDCKFTQECLCFSCDNTDCRTGLICKKERGIVYCNCRNCDGENCNNCGPEIY
jgi:hypothetical protein